MDPFNKEIFAILLTIAIGWSSSHAIIQSCALFKTHYKKVLVLGDFHGSMSSIGSPYYVANEKHFDMLVRFIEYLSQCPVKTKILLEASRNELDLLEQLQSKSSLACLEKIALLAKHNNFLHHSVSFSCADYRIGAIGNLHTLYAYVHGESSKRPMSEILNKDLITKMLGDDPSLCNVFDQINWLIKKFDNNIKSINSHRLNQFTHEQITYIKKYKKLAESIFSEQEKQMPFTNLFINMVYTQSVNCFFNHGTNWLSPLCCNIMEVGLIITLVKSLKSYNQIILLTGHAHARVVQQFLITLGFIEYFNEGLKDEFTNPIFFNDIDLEYLLTRFII